MSGVYEELDGTCWVMQRPVHVVEQLFDEAADGQTIQLKVLIIQRFILILKLIVSIL